VRPDPDIVADADRSGDIGLTVHGDARPDTVIAIHDVDEGRDHTVFADLNLTGRIQEGVEADRGARADLPEASSKGHDLVDPWV
jgi:hypothetical protein